MHKLSFEEWLRIVFKYPIESEDIWDPNRDFPPNGKVESPNITVGYVTRLFNNSHILNNYREKQVADGLSYIVDTSISSADDVRCLYHPDISIVESTACLNSIYSLFKEYFAVKCGNKLISLLKNPSRKPLSSTRPLENLCFMWWDTFPGGWIDNTVPDGIEERIVQLLSRILKISSLSCQESAIHGLGHYYQTSPKQVEAVVDEYLKNNPNLDQKFKDYVLKAKVGKVL